MELLELVYRVATSGWTPTTATADAVWLSLKKDSFLAFSIAEYKWRLHFPTIIILSCPEHVMPEITVLQSSSYCPSYYPSYYQHSIIIISSRFTIGMGFQISLFIRWWFMEIIESIEHYLSEPTLTSHSWTRFFELFFWRNPQHLYHHSRKSCS